MLGKRISKTKSSVEKKQSKPKAKKEKTPPPIKEEDEEIDLNEVGLRKTRTLFGIEDIIKTNAKKKSLVKMPLSKIGCKMKRLELFEKRKKEIGRLKLQLREKRRQEEREKGLEKMEPIKIEDQREVEEDFLFENDEAIEEEEQGDEFSRFFEGKESPKIMMTTASRPSRKLFDVLKEMKLMIPQCHYYPRHNHSIKEIAGYAANKNYTNLLVFREHRKTVNKLILIHLPDGPTATFKITSFVPGVDISNHGNPTDHLPELILKNFNTAMGRRLGRFIASLFPLSPEFKGRRVVTFHNQRDFIFLRHHRYIFDDKGEKVSLQELGPKLTLKLVGLQKGIWDNELGEHEWVAKDNMFVSRKKFYL